MHEIAHWLGLDNASGALYLFWSGIFGDVTIIVAGLVFIRKHNCHARWCWRIGRHEVSGTHYITCRKHHPAHPGSKPATAEQISDTYNNRMDAVADLLSEKP